MEYTLNPAGVVALLCRDLFTVWYAELTLNYSLPLLAHLDVKEIPELSCFKQFEPRYLTARTCCPDKIISQLRDLRFDRASFPRA